MAKKSNVTETRATDVVDKIADQVSPTPVKRRVSQKTTVVPAPATANSSEKPLKKEKPKKTKMIRDSFTMPENDYVKLGELKKKCLQAGVHVKKSELIRAGLQCLSKLTDTSLLKTIEQVEVIKTGRPVKG